MKTKQVKKLLRKYCKWWIHWMGLGYWDIHIYFKNNIKNRPGNRYLAGHTDAIWMYQTAQVEFYPKALLHCTKDEIEGVVIHELVHILTNELREDGTSHEERAVTQLQKAFSWVKGARHA